MPSARVMLASELPFQFTDPRLMSDYIDAEPEARGILIEEDVLATADFGSLYNAF